MVSTLGARMSAEERGCEKEGCEKEGCGKKRGVKKRGMKGWGGPGMVVLQAGMCTSRPVYFASEDSCCYIDSVGDVVIV